MVFTLYVHYYDGGLLVAKKIHRNASEQEVVMQQELAVEKGFTWRLFTSAPGHLFLLCE